MGCCNSKKKSTVDSENEPAEQQLLSEDKLRKEMDKSFKEGDSGYAKQKTQKKLLSKKSIDKSQYNQKGLIDEKSKEFEFVKNFVKERNYDLICSIGSGNYAEVYKGFSKKYNKYVAIKVILLTKENADYREKFLPEEVFVLKECQHPNIIKIYEIAQSHKKVFMIMEFAENGTLADWLKTRGTLSESTAHLMFTKILEALHHMHSRQIAHRDLKLENILVTAKFQPKISDFSFSLRVNSLSTTHCGSLPYFSPEILKRQPHNPLISDIWSLGVCFYIMLNDNLPFKLGDDALMLQKQLNREWSFKPKIEPLISVQLKSMIKRMLEPDTKLRATTVQLLEDPWIKTFQPK